MNHHSGVQLIRGVVCITVSLYPDNSRSRSAEIRGATQKSSHKCKSVGFNEYDNGQHLYKFTTIQDLSKAVHHMKRLHVYVVSGGMCSEGL